MANKTYKNLEELLKEHPKKPLGRSNDMTGQHINKVEFICRVQSDNNRLAYWALKCDCGNYFVARAYSIIQNNTTSCGCEQEKARHMSDHSISLVGKQVGWLTVEERAGKDISGNATWLCRCKCGNTRIVSTTSLNYQTVVSCVKCANKASHNEIKIRLWLEQHNFNFEEQYRVQELGLQRFDFKVNLQNKEYILIEMQGQQHYQPITCFGGEEKFKIQQLHDKQKQEYCQAHNIPLLIIKYDEDIEQKLNSFLLS